MFGDLGLSVSLYLEGIAEAKLDCFVAPRLVPTTVQRSVTRSAGRGLYERALISTWGANNAILRGTLEALRISHDAKLEDAEN